MEREQLGLYELERLLGRGGMGAVYLAHDPRLSRRVALKVLSAELAERPGFRERFYAEARACSRLNHPGITTIHEVGEADGFHFIALEHVEGETLEALLTRGPLPLDTVRRLGLGLADALAHAHANGVVHRDLKPANVMITASGEPKILDFGLAKHVIEDVHSETDTLARLTQAGTILGTVAYMAPEQALGQAVDARADVFAFGAVLHEMLTGERAFDGMTPTQVLDRLLHGEPAPLRRSRPDAPDDLVRIVAGCLEKKPEDRFLSIAEVATILCPSAGTPPRRPAASGRRGRLHPWMAAAAALGLGLASFLFIAERDGPTASTEEDAVGVMYFENLTDPADSERLALMLTQLVTSELATIDGLHVTSRQRLRDLAADLRGDGDGSGNEALNARVASRVAAAAGIGRMVVGQVAEAGDSLVASVEIVDVGSGRSLASGRAQARSKEQIFELAASLGEQIRMRLYPDGAPTEARETIPEPTDSLEAYRHYVAGEAAMARGELSEAIDAFSDAVLLDPQFALAQFRLSMAARWLSEAQLSHQAARRAAAVADRAPSYLRDVIRANALYQDGAYSQAIPLLEAALERDPDQKESLYILGQIYVHSLRDGNLARAIELFEHLLGLDPGFEPVYDRLALSYAFRGDFASARERIDAWEGTHPDEALGLRSILATFEGQPEETLGFGQTFSWVEGPLFQASAAMMASRWSVARRLVESEVEEWRSDALRAWAFRNQAVLYTYVGEMDEAERLYRQAGAASGFRTHEGSAGGVPASALQLLAELLELEGEPGAARREADAALALQPESARGLYFAGRMALVDDDPDAASDHASTLARVAGGVEGESASMVYLAALEGEVALASGDIERAVERFETSTRGSLMLDWASTSSSAGAAIREGLARAYLAAERKDDAEEALRELIASGPERVDHPVVYARALHRLGVMQLERGNGQEGRRLLERLLEMWGDADREIAIVEDARERLGS